MAYQHPINQDAANKPLEEAVAIRVGELKAMVAKLASIVDGINPELDDIDWGDFGSLSAACEHLNEAFNMLPNE